MLRIAALLPLLLVVLIAPVTAQPNDPIIRMHSDVAYDMTYVTRKLDDFLRRLEAEFGTEDAVGDQEMFLAIRDLMRRMGLDDVQSVGQQMTLDERGWSQTIELQMDPRRTGTPLERWSRMAGMSSTFSRALPDDQMMMVCSVHWPGDLVRMARKALERGEDFDQLPGGELPGAALDMAKALGEYLPMMEQVLTASDAITFVIYDLNVEALKAEAAMLIEYSDSAERFRQAMAAYSVLRGMTWTNQQAGEYTVQVLNDRRIPLQLTMLVQDNAAILALAPETAVRTYEVARHMPAMSGGELHKHMRLNLGKLRDAFPRWAMDLAVAQAEAQTGAMPTIEYHDLLDQPMGVMDVRCWSDPAKRTLAMGASVDRGTVHVVYKLYERGMAAGMMAAIREQREQRKLREAEMAGEAVRDALEEYYAIHEEYPTSLARLWTADIAVKPVNPYTGRPIQDVTFDQRAPGEVTYIPIRDGRKVTGFQLLFYGNDRGYNDAITNDGRAEDGTFIEEPDGYEDLVYRVFRGPWTGGGWEDADWKWDDNADGW